MLLSLICIELGQSLEIFDSIPYNIYRLMYFYNTRSVTGGEFLAIFNIEEK